ncbi:hypothetical protein EJ913_30785 [Azospirillum doebereinerae]|uniref:Uncharacterized protein n=1 Tax=Azospirillum doebereinerae TaxID=92933 RepID=A0A433IZ97_9PROT|nr:hypothetical protein EJ913_30785 [Azospirillum doebereinerae]
MFSRNGASDKPGAVQIDIAIELEPEDGCLTVFGPGEQWFYALTEDGVENLKELIQIHRTRR